MHDRRSFLKQASLLVAGTQAGLLLPFDPVTTRAAAWFQTNNGASASASVAETAYGKVRGTSVEHIKIFRSEEHTSELQSHSDLVCRLLLEKKKHKRYTTVIL